MEVGGGGGSTNSTRPSSHNLNTYSTLAGTNSNLLLVAPGVGSEREIRTEDPGTTSLQANQLIMEIKRLRER